MTVRISNKHVTQKFKLLVLVVMIFWLFWNVFVLRNKFIVGCGVCVSSPEEIELEIVKFLIQEHNDFNHFRFVFEMRDEHKAVVPVIAVS